MDLYAYSLTGVPEINNYIEKHYGDVPRLRGVRFMAVEKKVDTAEVDDEGELQYEMFNRYVGEDVIFIHTRCGDCGLGFGDSDSNYVYCGGKEWEEKHKDLFLNHHSDGYDPTYCDHYFKAVVDDEYKAILNMFKNMRQGVNTNGSNN